MLGLAIVGLPRAGKSEFLRIAAERGFACLEWSNILAPEIGLEAKGNRIKMHDAAARQVQSKGISHYPRKIFHVLSASAGVGHLVSGARNPRELECLGSYYSSFRVVWISSHYLARFTRRAKDDKAGSSGNLEEFVRQDMYELAHGLAEIGCSLVNDMLFNDSDLQIYREAVLTYLSRFSAKGD